MDDILNLTDADISSFLDIPNSLCDDEIFRELDTLDFSNEFDDDLIYEYENGKHLCNPDTYKASTNSFHLHERNTNYVNDNVYVNNYGNLKSNEISVIKNEVHDNAEQKLMIIRELLDSDICGPTNGIMTALQNNNNRAANNSKSSINLNPSPLDNNKTNNQRNITSKPPAILPATNNSSASILKTPTLAATLIGMQPSKMNTNNMDNHSNNGVSTGGRVVRRNSHNAIEKRYRLSINDKIDELRHMLFLGDDSKMNKSNVLKKAIERIKCLEDENNALKCENYNLRISKNLPINNNRNSVESLNRTGSSPSSNNSDSGHSIENSPSSSSMHSSSVNSGCLFLKSEETSDQKLSSSNRGIKRPLIYNSNNNNNDNSVHIIKNEKLARLLLDPKDNYTNKHYEIQGNRNSNKFHSSNVPGFLLCTIALFVVSFQPLDVILKNYQMKSSMTTGGRQLLNTSPDEFSSKGYLFALLLTLAHWSVAFILVYGSASNRFILKKLISLLLFKLHSLFSYLIYKKTSHATHSLVDLKNSLKESYHQDQDLFKSQLKSLIEEYGCSYRLNPIMKFIQFSVCMSNFFMSFFQLNLNQNKSLDDTEKIKIYLLTVAIDQSVLDQSSYSQFEILWYKFLFYFSSWNAEISSDTLFSKFVFSLSISTGFVRRFFLKKVFETAKCHLNLVSGKLQLFLLNGHAQKMFIETNPQKLMDKFNLQCLDKKINSEKQSLVNCYFMIYAQETIETASQIILDGKTDDNISDQLKDIINCCPTILNDNESTYFSLWCCLLLGLLKDQDSQYLDKVVTKLINHYSLMPKKVIKNSNDSMNSSVGILKLLLSTLRLCGNEEDRIYHDINIKCMQDLVDNSKMNIAFRMILKLSLTRIIQALSRYNSMSSTSISNIIYYINTYSKQLNKQYKQQSDIEIEMVSEFEALLQNLCQLNPMKLITLNIQEKDNIKHVSNNHFKKRDDLCFRITDFLSCDRDSKLRSH